MEKDNKNAFEKKGGEVETHSDFMEAVNVDLRNGYIY
jgi:hypothetical protein